MIRRIRTLMASRWLFAVLYLLLIPVFMSLYAWRAGDFYSASPTQEQAYQSAVAELGPILAHDLDADLTPLTTVSTPSSASMSIARRDVRFNDLEVPDDRHVTINFFYLCRGIGVVESGTLALTVETHYSFATYPSAGGGTQRGVRVQQDGGSKPCNADVGQLLGVQHLPGTDTVAYVGQPFLHLAGSIDKARDGYLDQLPGRFERAAYLSTVVVTTLGFGDVVPVTGVARTLIGIEAVLGIMFAGLFLNAVSQTRRASSSTPSPTP